MTVTHLNKKKHSKFKKAYEAMSYLDLLQDYAALMGRRCAGEIIDPEQGYHLFNTLANLRGASNPMVDVATRYAKFYEQQLDESK